MSDGLGSVSYGYNQLSQLTSETRTLPVGSFALSYGYNLAGELTSVTNPWSAQVGYGYDNTGRLTNVSGSGYAGVSNYASGISYRAWGNLKSMNYGDQQALSTAYDNRLRPTTRNVSNVLGYNYNYDYYNERTGRVTYAQSIYDSTLDRSYQYDQVGALVISHSGAEARASAFSGQWGIMDGPYSQGYDYDKFGNMTRRYGWGGEVQGGSAGQTSDIFYNYTNNRRNGFSYDPAGNLTNDLAQSYSYDATGQQATASSSGYFLQQGYDGNGLRAQKTENGAVTYYIRSSVLGGQVVAEIDGNGGWQRGYVYAGSSLLAVQQGGVNWVHEDSVTKSKRVTDVYGNIVSNVELDPWGADTSRSSNTAFQPQSFTSYIRDANGGQDAMARRYSIGGRFAQPDSYGGSYDFSDPQSLNRYAYTKNDPVNFRDPSGMVMSEFCGAEYSFVACGGNGGFWGGGDFGGHVAEYNREYEGLPANIAGAMRLIDQRIGNARGGLGFRTSAEILAEGRATSAHAWINYDGVVYDAGGVVWIGSMALSVQPVAPDNTTFRGISFGLSAPAGIGGSVTLKVDNHQNIYVSGGPTFGVSTLISASYIVGETKQNGVNVTDERSVRNVLSGPSSGVTLAPTGIGGNFSWNTWKLGGFPIGFLSVPFPSGSGTSGHAQFGTPEVGYSPQITFRVPGFKF